MSAGQEERFQLRLASGENERCDSLRAAGHVIARRVASDTNPLDPRNVLAAEIWRRGRTVFGGGLDVETIATAAELSVLVEPDA